MLSDFQLSLAILGFLVFLGRFIIHTISIRLALRHVPGPSATSLIWGEEWLLYHGTPGAPYIDWHMKFGKVVKFRGAFGHQLLSITDPLAISFIIGENVYNFPKPHGVRAWFKALLGEGILWIEGMSSEIIHVDQDLTIYTRQRRSRKATPNAFTGLEVPRSRMLSSFPC